MTLTELVIRLSQFQRPGKFRQVRIRTPEGVTLRIKTLLAAEESPTVLIETEKDA